MDSDDYSAAGGVGTGAGSAAVVSTASCSNVSGGSPDVSVGGRNRGRVRAGCFERV